MVLILFAGMSPALANESTIVAKTFSDPSGQYVFINVPDGLYDITAVKWLDAMGRWFTGNASVQVSDGRGIADMDITMSLADEAFASKLNGTVGSASVPVLSGDATISGRVIARSPHGVIGFDGALLSISKQAEQPSSPSKQQINILFILHERTSIHWYYLEEAMKDLVLNNTHIDLTIYDPVEAAANDLSSFDIIALQHVQFRPDIQERLDAANHTSKIVYISDKASLWTTNVDQKVSTHAYSKYWVPSGTENHRNLLVYLAVELKGAKEHVNPGIALSQDGIFHPDYKAKFQPCNDGLFKNISSYMEWYKGEGKYNPGMPTVGLSISGYYYANGYNLDDWIALIREFEGRGVNVIPILDKTDARQVFFDEESNSSRVDIVLAYMGTFHGTSAFNTSSIDERKAMIAHLGVPWINCITTSQTPDEWNSSKTGIPASYTGWAVALQEAEGLIEPIVIGGTIDDEVTGIKLKVAIPGRAQYVADRALKWAALKRLDNGQKKVAFIYYSYPPGKSEIGASYMDVPRTLEVLLNSMYDAGYDLGPDFTKYDIGNRNDSLSNKDSIVEQLISRGRNVGTWAQDDVNLLAEMDAIGLIPESKYREWFSELPSDMQQSVIDVWGDAPGDQMVYVAPDNVRYLVIPHIRYGNILLAPQPYKGYQNNEKMLYHNTSMPPNHQYVAFYLWLKKEYDASALVHVGTHGTLEWLPGKELGLCSNSWPEALIQDLPNPYIYIVDNVGEGTQAKRRAYSVIIDHMTPPFVPSGLYGNYSNLHQALHMYMTSKDNNNTALMDQYMATSVGIIKNMKMDKDLDIVVSEYMDHGDFESIVVHGKVHDHLHDMMYANIPFGLHIFGTPMSDEAAVILVRGMLGSSFIEHVQAVNASCDGHDEEQFNTSDSFRLLYCVLVDGKDIQQAQEDILGASSDDVKNDLVLAKEYHRNILLSPTSEINGLLTSLDGKYVAPSVGGDMLRSPEVLPTGKNFYSFDPRLIPTKEAYAIGAKTTDQFLVNYYETHGCFPEKVAVVLWGIETMRNHGVPHSQMLYLMGVEPKWSKNGRVTYYTSSKESDLRLLTDSELTLRLSNGTMVKRPRIDVIGHSSGLHRDQFPWQMALLDDAVRLVAKLEGPEDMNFVKKNSQELKAYYMDMMKEAGVVPDEAEAEMLSMSRIFAPPESDYGVRIADAVGASDSWDNTDKIADQFIDRSGNIYVKGEMYTSPLISGSSVLKASLKDTDAAFFIRSSNLYGVLTGDDPFQYFGGLSLAISRVSDGARPEMWVTNARNTGNPQMQTLKEFMNLEKKTQMFNPRYISGMMEHGYAGANKLSDHLTNLWGWDAVDSRFVSSDDWNEVYDVYVLDKYDLGTKEWFNTNNPWARQNMLAQMLEANRKKDADGDPYWSASDDVISALASEYTQSVQQYGPCCCMLCCSNALLDTYVQGILTVPSITPEPKTSSSSSSSSTGTMSIVDAASLSSSSGTSGNQTMSTDGGYGTEATKTDVLRSADNYVSGYEMQAVENSAEQSSSSLSFSGASLLATLFVLLAAGAIYMGFRKK